MKEIDWTFDWEEIEEDKDSYIRKELNFIKDMKIGFVKHQNWNGARIWRNKEYHLINKYRNDILSEEYKTLVKFRSL